MGLHLPGRGLRQSGHAAARRADPAAAVRAVRDRRGPTPTRRSPRWSTRRASSTAIVGLLATGGSTNHTLHLVAMARAAGILIDWEDFGDLSQVTPLLARVYPNGSADVNHFHAAGGMAFVVRELLDAGPGPRRRRHRRRRRPAPLPARAVPRRRRPWSGATAPPRAWRPGHPAARRRSVRRRGRHPHPHRRSRPRGDQDLGGQARAPHRSRRRALVFDDQDDCLAAFKRGELDRDFVAVVRFQGPKRQRHARAAQA